MSFPKIRDAWASLRASEIPFLLTRRFYISNNMPAVKNSARGRLEGFQKKEWKEDKTKKTHLDDSGGFGDGRRGAVLRLGADDRDAAGNSRAARGGSGGAGHEGGAGGEGEGHFGVERWRVEGWRRWKAMEGFEDEGEEVVGRCGCLLFFCLFFFFAPGFFFFVPLFSLQPATTSMKN